MTSWFAFGTFRVYAEWQALMTMVCVLFPLLIVVLQRPNVSGPRLATVGDDVA
jgi:hypothetical protein